MFVGVIPQMEELVKVQNIIHIAPRQLSMGVGQYKYLQDGVTHVLLMKTVKSDAGGGRPRRTW